MNIDVNTPMDHMTEDEMARFSELFMQAMGTEIAKCMCVVMMGDDNSIRIRLVLPSGKEARLLFGFNLPHGKSMTWCAEFAAKRFVGLMG